MSTELTNLRKKRAYPSVIFGDTYFLRGLTWGELNRLENVPQKDKSPFIIGCGLCRDPAGEPSIPRNKEEPIEAWIIRVSEALDDVPTETIRELNNAIGKAGQAEPVEKIAGN